MLRSKILIFITTLVFIWMGGCQEGSNPVENPISTITTPLETPFIGLAKATTVMTKDTINEYWQLSGECLNELLDIYYSDELRVHTTIDNQGGFHTVMHWRPINTIAYGVESGNIWIPVGAVPIIEHSGKVGEVFTEAGCYNWKAQQEGPSLTEPWILHCTVNANGVMTVNREVYRFICK